MADLVRTTIYLPKELHKRLKLLAIKRDTSVTDLLISGVGNLVKATDDYDWFTTKGPNEDEATSLIKQIEKENYERNESLTSAIRRCARELCKSPAIGRFDIITPNETKKLDLCLYHKAIAKREPEVEVREIDG